MMAEMETLFLVVVISLYIFPTYILPIRNRLELEISFRGTP